MHLNANEAGKTWCGYTEDVEDREHSEMLRKAPQGQCGTTSRERERERTVPRNGATAGRRTAEDEPGSGPQGDDGIDSSARGGHRGHQRDPRMDRTQVEKQGRGTGVRGYRHRIRAKERTTPDGDRVNAGNA